MVSSRRFDSYGRGDPTWSERCSDRYARRRCVRLDLDRRRRDRDSIRAKGVRRSRAGHRRRLLLRVADRPLELGMFDLNWWYAAPSRGSASTTTASTSRSRPSCRRPAAQDHLDPDLEMIGFENRARTGPPTRARRSDDNFFRRPNARHLGGGTAAWAARPGREFRASRSQLVRGAGSHRSLEKKGVSIEGVRRARRLDRLSRRAPLEPR